MANNSPTLGNCDREIAIVKLQASGSTEEFEVHVVIVGCGRVGSSLARELVALGHTVAIIDRKPEAFVRLGDDFTGQKITGIGFDHDTLISAGIERADALAAVTNGDNSNILVARVAREKFSIERVVARIYDPKRAAIYERVGIATVATVKWTSERILRRILPDAPAVEWTDPSAKVVVVERDMPAAFVGKRLLSIDIDFARVVALRRLGTGLIPNSDTIVQQGDVAYVSVELGRLAEFDAQLSAGNIVGKDR